MKRIKTIKAYAIISPSGSLIECKRKAKTAWLFSCLNPPQAVDMGYKCVKCRVVYFDEPTTHRKGRA